MMRSCAVMVAVVVPWIVHAVGGGCGNVCFSACFIVKKGKDWFAQKGRSGIRPSVCTEILGYP